MAVFLGIQGEIRKDVTRTVATSILSDTSLEVEMWWCCCCCVRVCARVCVCVVCVVCVAGVGAGECLYSTHYRAAGSRMGGCTRVVCGMETHRQGHRPWERHDMVIETTAVRLMTSSYGL